ncbi:MAG: hypothetical protein JWM14_3338 [Chitinophagaceae bacterium]|nr:hypothetical protein [Chitinophagaceae bacterium]
MIGLKGYVLHDKFKNGNSYRNYKLGVPCGPGFRHSLPDL